MALSDFTPDTADVMYKGKTLVTVRGLNLEDISILMRNHIGDLQTIYAMVAPSGKLLPSSIDVDNVLFSLLTNAPNTAVKMIQLAANEPDADAARKVERMPAPLQLKILIEIVKLTFEDVGGPLEFGAMLRQLMPRLPSNVLNSQTIQ